MTDLERCWFEAGRRARQDLDLPAPPSFYALLAATRRASTRQDPADQAGSCTDHDRPSPKEKVNAKST